MCVSALGREGERRPDGAAPAPLFFSFSFCRRLGTARVRQAGTRDRERASERSASRESGTHPRLRSARLTSAARAATCRVRAVRWARARVRPPVASTNSPLARSSAEVLDVSTEAEALCEGGEAEDIHQSSERRTRRRPVALRRGPRRRYANAE